MVNKDVLYCSAPCGSDCLFPGYSHRGATAVNRIIAVDVSAYSPAADDGLSPCRGGQIPRSVWPAGRRSLPDDNHYPLLPTDRPDPT